MRVVVIGGGFGGLASAARLAKLGHEVTLVEASPTLGGALKPFSAEGHTWSSVAGSTLLPAVLRDLFRKSGRPVEREIADLEPLPAIREHRFPDRTRLLLPGGSRAAQVEAFDGLVPGLGERWAAYVESHAENWDLLRRHLFEVPPSAAPPREVVALLRSRESLRHRLHGAFGGKEGARPRLVAGHPLVAAGSRLRDVPAWMGLTSYLEQRFGAWTVPGGMQSVAEALTERMQTRGVTVLTRTVARDLVLEHGRVRAVTLADGTGLDADAVVVAVDPRRLPALARLARNTLPAIPPRLIHLALAEAPEIAPEVVLHGDPTLVIRPEPHDPALWTVQVHGKLYEDLPLALARHRLDIREQVLVQVERGPATLVEEWGGSPLGIQWAGRSTLDVRLGPTTPIPGVYAAGAHAATLPGLPGVGLSAATVAQAITTDAGGGDLRA